MTATPLRYALSLEVDPNQPRFTGQTRILVSIPAATSYVVLHARDIHVTRALARAGVAEVTAAATARAAHGAIADEELVLTFAHPLPVGEATLEITYDAPFGDALAGLYRVSDGARWYAFTQFEATDARRAFPCFDEPASKVPFDVAVTVPTGMIAIGNTPETSRRDLAHASRFEFATTPPMPTYLVALAIGDFDVRAGQASPVAIRLIATKGRAGLGAVALDASAALLQRLADYFAIPYPYAKLDIVAVPDFAAGAMENPGLVTFREELLLLDPAHTSVRARRSQATTIAHELAHMWFGDMVTMQWWNDLWLNEGFATWAETKIVDAWKPSLDARLERVAGISSIMDTDALRSARAVRQPVTTTSEAIEAFDDLTYAKGAFVLAMIEHAVGADVFQKAVQSFLRAHAWKNATANDLLVELDQASGRDVSAIAASFLDRAGVPSLLVGVACDGPRAKGLRVASISLQQSPWTPLGIQGANAAATPPPWTIPVAVTTSSGEKIRREIGATDVAGATPLAACPAWVYPNTDDAGYYRFALDEKGWTALTRALDRLESSNRVGLLANLWASVRAGTARVEVLLRALPLFDRETNRVVIEEELGVLAEIDHALVENGARAAFRAYASARLTPHLRALAANRRDEDAVLLRASLFGALGELADDAPTLTEADRLARAWLTDPTSVDPDLAEVAVVLGSRHADAARLDALRAAAHVAKSPDDHELPLRALGGFEAPDMLRRALDVALTDEVKTQDVLTIIGSAAAHRASQPIVIDWMMTHWEKLRGKLTGSLAGGAFSLVGTVCSRDAREAASAFFSPRAKDVEGAQRPLAEGLERASLCAALREAAGPATSRYFGVKP